jgi:hypothetical protein
MGMRRNLVGRQRDLFRATGFREDETVALMNRQAAAQIGQREGRFAIAAVGGADELE